MAALLPVRERVLGPEHPATLTARANLARWTGMAGDAAGARDQFAALLPVRERVSGPEHPDTLTDPRQPRPLDQAGGGRGAWRDVAPACSRTPGSRDQRDSVGAADGAPGRDLPERYGPWKTRTSERLRRWTTDGTWDRILADDRKAGGRGRDDGRGRRWAALAAACPPNSTLLSVSKSSGTPPLH